MAAAWHWSKFNFGRRTELPGMLDVLKRLIDAGADLNIQDKSIGRTALMETCLDFIGNVVGAKYLIDAGADLNIQDNSWGHTALHLASSSHVSFEIVKYLINAGANLNIQNKHGKTPLIYAAVTKDFDWKLEYETISFKAIKELIKAGADTNIKDNSGKDVFDYLKPKQVEEILKRFPKQCEEYIMKKNSEKYNL